MRPPPGPVSSPSRQGGEGWFPWVVGFAALLLLFVWGGAALAARLTTGRTVRLSDAGAALVALPAHFDDPRLAWPIISRSALPGPVAYWAAQALVLGALVATGAAVWMGWRRGFGHAPGPLGVPHEAGLGGRRDLRRLTVRRPHGDRLTLGR